VAALQSVVGDYQAVFCVMLI